MMKLLRCQIGLSGWKTERFIEGTVYMEMKNNNKTVEKELAKVYYKKNKGRNYILILSIALSLFLLYSAFSIASGKIRADYLIDVRGMGTLASVSLENGSKTQLEQMCALPYLANVGVKKYAAEGSHQDRWNGRLVYVDDITYNEMLRPAYTDIYGSYPQKSNEIMISLDNLQQMGIVNPIIGQEIELTIDAENSRKNEKFLLTGYYTDYIDNSITVPEVYVSEKYLEEKSIPLFPVDKIMAVQASLEQGEDIEKRLYSDLHMEYESQQVFGENPMVLQSVEGLTGSVSIAVGCALLVIACAFMLIYNVTSISMGKDIQEYGLLKVLGTTDQQLKRISYRQNIRNIMYGTLYGSIISLVIVGIFLQKVLQKLFMQGYGSCDVNVIYPIYLVGSIVIITITMFFATNRSLRQVMKWNAIRSVKFVDADINVKKNMIRSAKGVSLFQMAWRNVTRSKKRLMVTAFSLILGGTVVLGSSVIMTGIDLSNKYESNPDFQVGVLTGIFRHPEKVPDEINDETPVMSNEMVTQIHEIEGINKNTINTVEGCYALIDLNKDEALVPRKNSINASSEKMAFATVQIVDEEYVEELEKYAKKYELPVDINSLKNGSGCVLLHYHEMSQILEEQAKEVMGLPIHFYSLRAYDQTDEAEQFKKEPLKCSGYVDCTTKYFPKLATTSMGNNINYFIMTEDAFQKLEIPKKVFDISFDAEEGQEEFVDQKLSQIVQRENAASGEMDTYYLGENYILIETEQNKIQTGNVVLGVLTLIILLVGIMNYINTIAATYATRKRELAIMECIGMTKEQLWKMTFLEGVCYWLITMTGIIFVGSVLIFVLGFSIKQKLLYFKFVYPWKQIIMIAVILLVLDFIFAIRLYFNNKQETLINRVNL